MRIYSRCITLGATAGLLMLGGASVLVAQQQEPRDTGTETGAVTTDTSATGVRTDTGQAGLSTDTALKAKPGVQTGPAKGDTGTAGATDTMTQPSGEVRKEGAKGYHHTGAPSDTALHAKPGTQTGKTSGDSTTAQPDSMR
jgi:hypothetical protein